MKKIHWQSKCYNKCTLVFHELQLIDILLLIRDSHMSWNTKFISLKVCMGLSIFDSVSFLLKFTFLFKKSMESLTLKRHNSFQNQNNKNTTHSFASRPLTFKFQHEGRKFNDVCVSWSSPKTKLEKNILNLRNQVLSTSLFLNSNV